MYRKQQRQQRQQKMLNYKFRLYPTKEQELVLEQTIDGCRLIYNYFLSLLPSPMSEYDMNYA
ncbi:MAG TPA: helix-turn-helix domain-containing protein, partial [Nitrososphaera sp.]|nr:helix-turn-helix domain-containing protein [Nitrososphaera sp.]